MKKNLESKKIADMELDNVSGGAHTCFAKKTYEQLGVGFNGEIQKGHYHPVITTSLNTCKFMVNRTDGNKCKDCIWVHGKGITGYCRQRSLENDPYKL